MGESDAANQNPLYRSRLICPINRFPLIRAAAARPSRRPRLLRAKSYQLLTTSYHLQRAAPDAVDTGNGWTGFQDAQDSHGAVPKVFAVIQRTD